MELLIAFSAGIFVGIVISFAIWFMCSVMD